MATNKITNGDDAAKARILKALDPKIVPTLADLDAAWLTARDSEIESCAVLYRVVEAGSSKSDMATHYRVSAATITRRYQTGRDLSRIGAAAFTWERARAASTLATQGGSDDNRDKAKAEAAKALNLKGVPEGGAQYGRVVVKAAALVSAWRDKAAARSAEDKAKAEAERKAAKEAEAKAKADKEAKEAEAARHVPDDEMIMNGAKIIGTVLKKMIKNSAYAAKITPETRAAFEAHWATMAEARKALDRADAANVRQASKIAAPPKEAPVAAKTA